MIRTDRDAFVCDLAETYGIFDYRAVPAQLLATLAAGLREESRSKTSLSERKATRMEVLLAAAVDRLSTIAWLLSAVCPAEGEGPRSVLRAILGEKEEACGSDAIVYDSPEEFEAEWERRTGVSHGR